MADESRILLIGGENDGKWVCDPRCPFIESVVWPGMEFHYEDIDPPSAVAIKRELHERSVLSVNGQKIAFARLSGMSFEEAIYKLLDGYRRPK